MSDRGGAEMEKAQGDGTFDESWERVMSATTPIHWSGLGWAEEAGDYIAHVSIRLGATLGPDAAEEVSRLREVLEVAGVDVASVGWGRHATDPPKPGTANASGAPVVSMRNEEFDVETIFVALEGSKHPLCLSELNKVAEVRVEVLEELEDAILLIAIVSSDNRTTRHCAALLEQECKERILDQVLLWGPPGPSLRVIWVRRRSEERASSDPTDDPPDDMEANAWGASRE